MSEALERQPFIFAYFKWHYGRGLREFFGVWSNLLWFIWNFFSFRLLLKTWFAPWKRMGEQYGSIFNFSQIASTFIVNSLMRIVGFVTKTVVLFMGLVSLLAVLLVFFLVLVIWILAPAVLLGCLALSFGFFIIS